MHVHRQLPLTPLLVSLYPLCKLLRLHFWRHREIRLLQISYWTMTRSRIILVHVRSRFTEAIQPLRHIRGKRPSSNHVRLWRLRKALLHRHPTQVPHPCPSSLSGRLQAPLECLLRPHLSLVGGNFARRTRGQLLPRDHRFQLCIVWLSQTSFTRLKYVTFPYLPSRRLTGLLGTERHARGAPSP